MSGEIMVSYETGKTLYFLARDRTGRVWNTSGGTGAFESYNSTVFASYPVSMVEQGTASAFYTGTFPPAIPPGVYALVAKRQAGGSPAESDPTVAQGDYQWGGSAALPLSDLATSGQVGLFAPLRLARGVMVSPFTFKMVSSVDHVTPFTSGVVSGQISKDGGAFGPLQSGAFTEVGLGHYKLQALTSGDMAANTISLVFTADGISGGQADQRDFVLLTQHSSGY